MSGHSIASGTGASIESVTTRLTDTILGAVEQDLAETLRAIANEIGLCHIAYLRLSPDKSADICLLVAVVTYSRLWQHRYFVKKYITMTLLFLSVDKHLNRLTGQICPLKTLRQSHSWPTP